jgi:hypothetical protein
MPRNNQNVLNCLLRSITFVSFLVIDRCHVGAVSLLPAFVLVANGLQKSPQSPAARSFHPSKGAHCIDLTVAL